ncbi:serine-rich adhesin for platelets-like [Littorina saxatilis]|uniref:Partner and localiser of BRCA2 WD40 domain-containing protein n=1 Tax=Littorina saxatilis TaxID=31220 RepID=A0AAN9C1H0_9CAEN
MERKQLAAKLELMKEELAQKQKKLEKAKRAARVKAHVKQKIKELNHQAKTESSTLSQCASTSKSADLTEEKQPCASLAQPGTTECVTSSVTSAGDSAKEPLDIANVTGASRGRIAVENEQVKTDVKGDVETNSPSSDTHGKAENEKTEVRVTQTSVDISEVDDSLAITPSFKSMRDTDLMGTYPQVLPPELDRITDFHSLENSEFTLELHKEISSCGEGTLQELQNDSMDLVSKQAKQSSESTIASVTGYENDQLKKAEQLNSEKTKAVKHVANIGTACATVEQGETCAQVKNCNTTADETVTDGISKTILTEHTPNKTGEPGQKTCSQTATVPTCKESTASLKLQDIGSAEGVASESMQQSSSSQSQKQDQRGQDQFLDYTELDAIPFSQFELTEDFLSEGSQKSFSSSTRRGRQKSMSALVQRRSPRLSGFEFDSSDKLLSQSTSSQRRSSHENNFFNLARKQKKTKKALLLSSLFQFLVDEAKRDPSFVEFKLPEDIASLAFEKNKETGKQTKDDTESSIPTGHYVVNSMDIEVIPETEIDPDLLSQRFCTADFDLGTNAALEEEQPEPTSDVQTYRSSESACLKADFTKPLRANSGMHEKLQPAIESLCAACENPADITQFSSTVHDRDIEGPKHDEEASKDRNGSSGPKTNLSQPKTHTGKFSRKKALKLKAKQSVKQDNTDRQSHCDNFSFRSSGQKECKHFEDGSLPGEADRCDPQNSTTTESPKSLNVNPDQGRLLATPKTTPPTVSTEACSSPILFGTQSQSSKDTAASDGSVSKQCGYDEEGGLLKDDRVRPRPVFTPSKSKDSDQKHTGDYSWMRYTGCAESGCRDPVVDTVVGTATTDDEATTFILSVQTTTLTLWTLDDQKEWSAEFHWYLPQTSEAQGACRIFTSDDQLSVLLWGVSTVSESPFLTVFVYAWDTQHTQRFSLPLPSPVTPHRLFCNGLPSSLCTMLVFATDKVYTRGKTYMVDWYQNSVTAEVVMEEVEAQLVDLRLVQDLPDAAVGIAEDQRILIWNHKKGTLIMSMSWPASVPKMSRMFSCYFLQGYLLIHTAEAELGRDVCLVALNPTANSGKVVRKFTAHSEQHCNWNQVVVHKDLLLSVCQEGRMHVWDACSAKQLVSFYNRPGKIVTAHLFHSKESCWLMTGQEIGCLHMYSVT